MPTSGNEMMPERLERVETKVDALDSRSTPSGRDSTASEVKVGLEDVRETLYRFENTLGGRLDALTREIAESRREFTARYQDHELVLTNHNQRITALERRPRRQT